MRMTNSCTLCGGLANFSGSADFNKSGNDHFRGHAQFPRSETRVVYVRCSDCGFLFSDHFAEWDSEDFVRRIYNREYLLADPPFQEERPEKISRYLAQTLGAEFTGISILDYGGGEGVLESKLRRLGFNGCKTYDPYHPKNAVQPPEPAMLVTAFEVIEHVWDQRALATRLESLIAPGGCLVFSTLVQPPEGADADWWYACPRNGHMSLHTVKSLRLLFGLVNLRVHSLTEELHVAYRSHSPLVERFTSSTATVRVRG